MPTRAQQIARTRARLIRVVRRRGGEMLEAYQGTQTKTLFRCDRGHEWRTEPGKLLYHETWCPTCARMQRPPEQWLAQLRRIAEQRGGLILSPEYRGDTVKLEFRCAEDHSWRATPTHIKQGRWCPKCARLAIIERSRAKFDAALTERAGTLLSQYVNTTTRLRIRCANGHEWKTTPHAVLYHGKWCPGCGRYSLADMQELATKWGGQCLSKTYVNLATPLRWRCTNGHTWEARPDVVRRGSWCRRCQSTRTYDLNRARELAHKRGGECLMQGSARVLATQQLPWRCREGHRWNAPIDRIQRGHWCAACAVEAQRGRPVRRLTLGDMQVMAARHGGQCLSDHYVNSQTALRWRCARGHNWKVQPGSIRNNGTWCPECAKRPPYTLEGMRALARAHGGRCLSTTWGEPLQSPGSILVRRPRGSMDFVIVSPAAHRQLVFTNRREHGWSGKVGRSMDAFV